MAAPVEVTIQDMSGKWSMNKSQGDDLSELLELQGIGWLMRKAITMAGVTLVVRQYTDNKGIVHIDIDQQATGSKGTTELRQLDGTEGEHSDYVFGKVKGNSDLIKITDITDAYLKEGWDTEEVIQTSVLSLDKGWTTEQIWGFAEVNGQRKHVRRILTKQKGKEIRVRTVYDWVGKA